VLTFSEPVTQIYILGLNGLEREEKGFQSEEKRGEQV